MKKLLISSVVLSLLGCVAILTYAQPPGPRLHKVTSKGELRKLPATSQPSMKSEVTIEIVGDERVIRSNGIPDHKTGQFPNRGNPNRISAQRLEYRIPANPKIADNVTPMQGEFGVAINGIPFDPGAAEFYDGEPGWQYEPLSGAIALGIDTSHAHVQPTGKYHYHGLPTGLLDAVKLNPKAHSPLIGWAADGFPMYAVYGYSDPKDPQSPIRKMTSSYQLKKGQRPGGNAPSGKYDGTFVRDYEFIEGSGDLDECNGMFTITPEYPKGTYAYFMTENWPVVPRFFRGTPSSDFMRGPGPNGRRGRGGRDRQQQFSQGEQPQRAPLSQSGMMPGPGPNGRGQNGRGPNGPGQMPGPMVPGEVLPNFLISRLGLSSSQQERMEELQKDVDEAIEKILSEDQQDILAGAAHMGQGGAGPQRPQSDSPRPGPGQPSLQSEGGPPGDGQMGPPGFQGLGRPPQPGEILPEFLREPLDLTSKQSRELDTLQTRVTKRLSRILTAEQRRMLQPPRPPAGPGFRGPGFGGPGFGGPGFGGPGYGGPGPGSSGVGERGSGGPY